MDRRTTPTHQARGLHRVVLRAAGEPSASLCAEPLGRARACVRRRRGERARAGLASTADGSLSRRPSRVHGIYAGARRSRKKNGSGIPRRSMSPRTVSGEIRRKTSTIGRAS